MFVVPRTLFGHIVRVSSRGMAHQHRHALTANITLIPVSPVSVKQGKTAPFAQLSEPRPLVILFQYMNAKKKHVDKFVEFYHQRNFDVLTATLSPWQLFFPLQGSQVVAREVIDFLLANENYSPLLYHGFSVGGYLWGEVMKTCIDHHPKYLPVTERIKGQIMDSGVSVTEIPTAFPAAVFPNNPKIQKMFEELLRWHMRVFFEQSTRHYIASRQSFTRGLINGPTLALYSDSDPMSSEKVNREAERDLTENNRLVILKKFKGSKHVMHFQKHREEYIEALDDFLEKLNLLPHNSREENDVKRQVGVQSKL